MKYINLTLGWAVAVGAIFLSVSASVTEADPTDDFSFTLAHSPRTQVYRLISEEGVSEILADRLDSLPQSQIPLLSRHIISLCKRYRFDPIFILSLIEVESGFHVKAVSSVGAIGLMQVMLGTAHYVMHDLGAQYSVCEELICKGIHKRYQGYPLSSQMLMDPFLNTSIGISYLAWIRDGYKGLSPCYVLAAYNMGPTKMNALLSRKLIPGKEMKKYFQSIRNTMLGIRFYRHKKVRISNEA